MSFRGLFGVVLAGCLLVACGGGGSGSSAGGGGSGGSGGAGGCTAASDCVVPAGDCQVATCEDGVCGTGTAPDGTVAPQQAAGDCKKGVCQAGAVTLANDDTDLPDDSKACTIDGCDAGLRTTAPAAAGTACRESGGNVCDDVATCVECNVDADCTSADEPLCDAAAHVCISPDCTNTIKDGSETDLDCGGACPPCDDGETCVVGADCESGVCTDAVCQAPACDDGVKNGKETDTDCGGTCAVKCGADQGCNEDPDCIGGKCTGAGGTCIPNCVDKAKNNAETDIDCGGGTCAACVVGAMCGASDANCQPSAFCNAGTCELKKVQGQPCAGGNQCGNGNCADGVCCNAGCNATCISCNLPGKVGTCTLVPVGQDPDADCPGNGGADVCDGNGSCAKPTGTVCGDSVDCASGYCVDGVCCQSLCGTACNACSMAKTGQPNGNCAPVTLGTDPENECTGSLACTGAGACAAPLPTASPCTLGAECQSAHCVDGVCCSSTCGGLCQACSAAKKASGTDGTCGLVATGTDPDNECAGALTCNDSGMCN